MDLEEHHHQFEAIAERHGLKNEEQAGRIADFLVSHPAGKVSAPEFSEEFGMSEEEAVVFLSFIDRGLRFKERVVDRKDSGKEF
ncbi:hypothetical protein JXA12_01630 [Candidatus Woesearchaeota archaeon]|nr:hypothetical protein [Candidatus Woesearchaeota archaeon]